MKRTHVALALALAAGCRSGGASRSDEEQLAPGAPPMPAELATRIRAASPGQPPYSNRLALETSPYLLQHAHNPVDWYPWGEEAFAAARRLGRPIFLSIGYSSCHWCHVMAHESFEDVEIATYLNQHYVSIKVDREERPDVDAVYMKAIEAMGKPGGWPLNMWLTADGKPFFGATYLPPRDGARAGAGGGLLGLLARGHDLHDGERDKVDRVAGELTKAMQEMATTVSGPATELDAGAIVRAVASYREHFDQAGAGLLSPGQRTRFPTDLPVRLLMRVARRRDWDKARDTDSSAWGMANLTLEHMAAGGIRDHVGGGFHRYSTDAFWRVPHFEKMLYDNALLASAYLEAGHPDFVTVGREILDFAERELGAPDGGFYAALDADSRDAAGASGEGLYYTWTPAEVEAAVGAEAAPLVRAWFHVSEAGNFEGRRSVLATRVPMAGLEETPEEADERGIVERALVKMAAARERRPHPRRDEKVVTAWNGLMISALVKGAEVLDRGDPASRYLARARRAATFVLGRMVGEDGRLHRVWTPAGGAHAPAVLDDYAFVIAGLLDLFEATGELGWLEGAIALDGVLARDFEDPAGGFFFTARDAGLLVREKPVEDGVLPSGNSVQAMNLDRLARLTGAAEPRARADRLWRVLAPEVIAAPTVAPELLIALDARLHPGPDVVLVAPERLEQLAPFLKVLGISPDSGRVTVPVTAGEIARVAAVVPLVEGKLAIQGKPTAFVCRERVCRLPVTDPAALAAELAREH